MKTVIIIFVAVMASCSIDQPEPDVRDHRSDEPSSSSIFVADYTCTGTYTCGQYTSPAPDSRLHQVTCTEALDYEHMWVRGCEQIAQIWECETYRCDYECNQNH